MNFKVLTVFLILQTSRSHIPVCGHEVDERLVLALLKDITGPLLDPFQFAYRAAGLWMMQSTWDYIISCNISTDLRILFVDFSSPSIPSKVRSLSTKTNSLCVYKHTWQ